jgi:hypothetical protein
MKKLFFYSILILVFLAMCSPESEEASNPIPAFPTPNPDISSVTVYLDDSEPEQSRAINREIALIGVDYFEAIFYHPNTGTVARAQWRIGERAIINNVYRTDTVINYGYTNNAYTTISSTIPPVTTIPANVGSAILLAGKSDKTIMGIGRLQAGLSSNITNATTSVTFDVSAIICGVNSDLALSSFATTSTPTKLINEQIASVYFMGHEIPRNTATTATYTFSLQSMTKGSFGAYADGIRLKSSGIVEKKQPRYSMPEGGNIDGNTAVPWLDELTTVTMTNNQAPLGGAFQPVVGFDITTTGTILGSIFALVFEIPVYALVPDCTWYIRPGYGVLKYELDDGIGGLGGAVLIRTGEAEMPVIGTGFKIVITKAPGKWRYRWATATNEPRSNPDEYDRRFWLGPLTSTGARDLTPAGPSTQGGLIVQKYDLSNNPLNEFGGTNIIPYSNLTFSIGKQTLPSTEAINGTWELPDEYYGLIEVTVKHTSNGVTEEDYFYILASGRYNAGVSGHAEYNTINFDYARLTGTTGLDSNIFSVPTPENFLDSYANGSAGNANQIKVMLLTRCLDIPDTTMNVNAGQSRLIMFVTATTTNTTDGITYPNIRLGRGGSGDNAHRFGFQGDNTGLAVLYFGKWPFANLLGSPTSLNTAVENFSVNAGGSYLNMNAYTTQRKMIRDYNWDGGIYNVKVAKGMMPEPSKGIAGTISFFDLLH